MIEKFQELVKRLQKQQENDLHEAKYMVEILIQEVRIMTQEVRIIIQKVRIMTQEIRIMIQEVKVVIQEVKIVIFEDLETVVVLGKLVEKNRYSL